MPLATQRSRHVYRRAGLVAGLLLALLVAVACGTDAESAEGKGFQKVTPSERVYAIEDFLAIGFRKNKQYDVEGLPAGIDAWAGFWGPDPYSRKDYELRFYASHEDAVEQGTGLAKEVTGEDAEEYRKNPTWKEGAKDRWQSARLGMGPLGGHVASGPSPKYGDFTIFGNLRQRTDAVRRGGFRTGSGAVRSPRRGTHRRRRRVGPRRLSIRGAPPAAGAKPDQTSDSASAGSA